MRAINRIAVIGATGMLGVPVTVALVEAGFAVTALVRNPDAARRILPAGVDVVAADVRDEESLRSGLEGHDGLHLNLSIAPAERASDFHTEAQGLCYILGAARAAGIKRIGYVSALIRDADEAWWVLDVWRSAIARIKASGIPYTIFNAGNVMETLAHRHSLGGALVMAGGSHTPNYWIAGADLGTLVARAFALEKAVNREFFAQGPEPVSYAEALKRYARARGDGMRVITVPLWLMRTLGVFSRPTRFNARMLATVLRYPEVFRAGPAWDELARPTTTIEDFARSSVG
jgi:uncharacterized protein YbjT (DUF2867 family)